jgi:VIT1/CCC1 family predicted Fe2+/Mn2+ transporter
VKEAQHVPPDRAPRRTGAVLDPVERVSEIVFGLIMAMTFTGSIHAASDGREEIRTMLFGAIGCNVAWGIVDAVMYLLTALITRRHVDGVLSALHRTVGTPEARRILLEEMPDRLRAALSEPELDAVERWAARQAPTLERSRLGLGDLRGASGVFLLVALSTFPLVLPFAILREPVLALRISHGVALAMLFASGVVLGRHSGLRPLLTGAVLMGIGLVLAASTIALGG